MTVSRSVLLRTRNVSNKRCTENQNTHFMCGKFFPKILPFMSYCRKRWCGEREATDENMAARCKLVQ